ncbi:hypothetical protein J6590_078164, partial [Homalodisca vitripennis]
MVYVSSARSSDSGCTWSLLWGRAFVVKPLGHSPLTDTLTFILSIVKPAQISILDCTDDTIDGSCVCFVSAQLETVPCWRPATITPHQQGGALITEQTVTIWVCVNLSSPLSLRKNLVVLALYQYSRPSPLSEADNIANPRGGVAEPQT